MALAGLYLRQLSRVGLGAAGSCCVNVPAGKHAYSSLTEYAFLCPQCINPAELALRGNLNGDRILGLEGGGLCKCIREGRIQCIGRMNFKKHQLFIARFNPSSMGKGFTDKSTLSSQLTTLHTSFSVHPTNHQQLGFLLHSQLHPPPSTLHSSKIKAHMSAVPSTTSSLLTLDPPSRPQRQEEEEEDEYHHQPEPQSHSKTAYTPPLQYLPAPTAQPSSAPIHTAAESS